MAGNNAIQISQLQVKNNADGSDQIVAYSNISGNVVITPVSNLYANTLLTANQVLLLQNNTPANSTANTLGKTFWSDGSYLYYAVSNNVIKRVALSSF
jgi:hypothetical protein